MRKGSVRVKNKNLKPFAGQNLLEIKIKQLKEISLIDKIVVNSDCSRMLEIATNLGVDAQAREEYYASSEATNSEFFENLGKTCEGEYILISLVTAPLIFTETYYDCIRMFLEDPKVDNLVTTSLVKHHLWLNKTPLNYNLEDAPNSQDLPDIHALTYGVCIVSREDMIKYRNVVTPNPTFKILNEIESIDIDTEFDFMVAELIYNKLYNKLGQE